MPPVIGAVALWVATATAFEIAVTVASIALTVGTTVYGAVAQKSAAKKAKRAAAKAREDFLNSLEDRTVTRIATAAPHRYVYGKSKVGADVVAILVSGENEQYKHIVSVHATGESESIDEIYINGKPCGPLDADGFVTQGDYYSASTENITETFPTSPFTLAHTPSSGVKVIAYGSLALGFIPTSGVVPFAREGNTIIVTGAPVMTVPGPVGVTHYSITYQYKKNTSQVRIRKHLGTADDPADASLIAECPSKWAATAVLRGFTYTVIRLDLRQAEFQGGLPEINVLMKGRKLYDPRTGLTVWSQNPALAILDYLTSPMCNVPMSDIPISGYITAANDCDIQVPGLGYCVDD